MNGVLGMTELVLNTPLNDQQRSYVSIVKESANALLMLLNDILDLSKIEAGRMELERIEFSLPDVVVQAARLLAVNASQKGLELMCRVAPNVPPQVLGDPNRVRQIIVNLVGNAVKFTTQGEIVVDLGLESCAGQQGMIHGVVRDTGIGIPQEKLSTVFEAFRQTDSSTTRRFGGTGLGLSISVQLVELMGGRMWVESELGKGSEFHFVIPLEFVAETASEGDGLPSAEPSVALLISTNASAQGIYAEMLGELGFSVQNVDGIEAAVERRQNSQHVADARPTLAVFDVGAAQSVDVTMAARLRDLSVGRELPLIFLVPAGQVEVVERCRELGLTHCLVKPIKKTELAKLIGSVLSPPTVVAAIDDVPKALEPSRPLRILVADDSPFNQQVAAGLLELKGHAVRLAADGRQAVELFKSEPFDIVFMDVEMPELDGLAATRMIRDLEQSTGAHIAIVGLSAHALVGVREQCLTAGMDAYITKPIQIDELFGALDLVAPSPEAVVGA